MFIVDLYAANESLKSSMLSPIYLSLAQSLKLFLSPPDREQHFWSSCRNSLQALPQRRRGRSSAGVSMSLCDLIVSLNDSRTLMSSSSSSMRSRTRLGWFLKLCIVVWSVRHDWWANRAIVKIPEAMLTGSAIVMMRFTVERTDWADFRGTEARLSMFWISITLQGRETALPIDSATMISASTAIPAHVECHFLDQGYALLYLEYTKRAVQHLRMAGVGADMGGRRCGAGRDQRIKVAQI